ncbi:MAG: hypothetical protein GX061_06055 [Eubacteriaceae bacterium]|nr:hypothetical protein [Eubacteriaceae bacterium]
MKKHISVLMLYVRSSLYKVLGVAALTGLLQVLFFYLALKNSITSSELIEAPVKIFKAGKTALMGGLGLVAISLIIPFTGMDMGAKPSYRLQRLRVTPLAGVIWQSVSNCLMLFIYYASQLAAVLICCRVYQRVTAIYELGVNSQVFFITFWTDSYLHGLLPLDDRAVCYKNAAMLLYAGISAAILTRRQQRGKSSFGFALAVSLLLLNFPASVDDNMVEIVTVVGVVALLVTSLAIYWSREERKKEL